jgi:hypothetical protein
MMLNKIDIQLLKEKFWKGETDLEEERILREYFENTSGAVDGDDVYFTLLGKDKEISLNEDFDRDIMAQIENSHSVKKLNPWFIRAAAAVILLGTITLFRYFRADEVVINPGIAETKLEDASAAEVAKAYEQTKDALLLISSKLNKGQQPAMLLGKFDQANQQVKQPIEQ